MKYFIQNATISNFPEVSESVSSLSSECCCKSRIMKADDGVGSSSTHKVQRPQLKLLDLYAGCGGMSTGLCQGAAIAGIELITGWAVDLNPNACDSLRFNHPETRVHNASADDFLMLLKSWGDLCTKYCSPQSETSEMDSVEGKSSGEDEDDDAPLSAGEFEVEKLRDICYGDPNQVGKGQLHFKVQWKGYGPEGNTWEPFEGFDYCEEKVKEFVIEGHQLKILPLPGTVDVACGGPPCQGVSGFNRFRNTKAPLEDEKNSQLMVFMNIIEYLKPKYVLMENVIDILKFKDGYLGRYAIGRLVAMKYQTRVGLLAAGRFGLPQFRMRAFFWGAHYDEALPQFPLSTHHVIGRRSNPSNFEVPDYAMSFVNGKSKKPFGRVWEDEIITTVVTRAEPHNQKVLHPHQDRVLSVRENARLQGFPDYYKLFGTVKERYIQVGNAVAVPVARALGYALGLACLDLSDSRPSLSLPPMFPYGP